MGRAMRAEQFKTSFVFVSYGAVLAGLYVARLHSYLLFHTIIETFGVCVAAAIFMLMWNARFFIRNNYLLFIGIAYLFIGGLDLIHALAYEGMGVFKWYGTNVATQLWISARYMESVSLVAALLFLKRRLRVSPTLLAYASVSAILLLSIFYWGIFPVCFGDNGLTAFKETSEFVIIGILAVSLVFLLRSRDRFEAKVLQWMGWSIGFTMVSELMFTMYTGPYEWANMMGHFLKLISFYLIYKALVETGLREPYKLLFRDIKESQDALQKARDELEVQVRRRTAELATSEERFRMMAEAIQDVFWMSTPGIGKIIYVSPGYEKVWGRSRDSLYESPMSFVDAVHPEDVERVVATLAEHAEGNWNLEYRIRKPDGTVRWILDRGFPIRDEKGNLYAITGLATDITQIKEMENSLREQAATMNAFFQHTITPLVFLDRNFNFIRVNEAYARACQRDVSELTGHNHFEFYPNEENQRIFEEVLRTRTPCQAFAKPFSFPDHPEWGVTYWDWTLVPVLDDAGQVEFLVFSLKDVTERERALRALKEKQQHLQNVISNAPVVLFAVDMDGTIKVSQGKALADMGRESGEHVGTNLFKVYSDYPQICENVRRALRGESFTTEVEAFGGRILEASYSPAVDEENNIVGMFGTAVDITERKARETEIMLARQYAEGIVDTIREALLVLDANLRVLSANHFFYDLFKTTPEHVVGRFIYEIGNRAWADPGFRELLEGILPKNSSFDGFEIDREFEGLGRRTMMLNARRIFGQFEKTQMILLAIQDITDRKQAEKEILSYQQELRALTSELLVVEERERRKIAAELHDSIGQVLAFLKIELGDLLRGGPPKELTHALRHAREQVSLAIKQARTLTFDISPPELYALGLGPAIEELGERLSKQGDYEFQFESPAEIAPLYDQVKVLLYRSVRELLVNAAKHARAKVVKVALSTVDDYVQVTVEDDGTGFQPPDIAASPGGSSGGFGLFSIRERLAHMGGRLEIESRRRSGTIIRLFAPLEKRGVIEKRSMTL